MYLNFLGIRTFKKVFVQLNKLTIPFMDDAQLNNLSFIQIAMMTLNDTALQDVLSMTGVNPLEKITGVKVRTVHNIDVNVHRKTNRHVYTHIVCDVSSHFQLLVMAKPSPKLQLCQLSEKEPSRSSIITKE